MLPQRRFPEVRSWIGSYRVGHPPPAPPAEIVYYSYDASLASRRAASPRPLQVLVALVAAFLVVGIAVVAAVIRG